MNKIFYIITVITTSLFFNACKQKPAEAILIRQLNTDGNEAQGSYLTHDNKKNLVLCWAEKDKSDSLYRLKYAIYDTKSCQFNPSITVPASAGSSISSESMNKIAFKDDGTIIAVFAKRFPNEKNPFACAIYSSSSPDNGISWSTAKYLHSDTSHAYGRGFVDMLTLKNGEIAAIWLDGRYKETINGSSLFFARTEQSKGFGVDSCLAKGTCECCRTDILTDDDGNIHIAYRSIMFPPGLLGRQVRDMAYTFSKDNGKTFSPAKVINKDNWAIEGCPHTGPSLAMTKGEVNAAWFTAGGNPGIYFSNSPGLGSDFRGRIRITSTGKHPQMTALSDGKLAIVCEETSETHDKDNITRKHSKKNMNMDHHKSNMMDHAPTGTAKIVLSLLENGALNNSVDITLGDFTDHHPVITPINNGLLVAWIREVKGKAFIYYSELNVN